MTKPAWTGGYGHVICKGKLGEFFLAKIPQKAHIISIYTSGYSLVIGKHERPMLSYYVIYYEMLKKVMQQTEKEALILQQGHYFIRVRQISTLCG